MFLKQGFWLVFWLFFTTISVGQNCKLKISGVVFDALNGQHLSDAVVNIYPVKQSGISDMEGHFHFVDICPNRYILECHLLGYESFSSTIELNKNKFIEIGLHLQPTHLKTVVVSANKTQKQILQPSQTLSQVELQKLSGKMLGDLLSGMEGMSVLQTGPSIFKPMLHGMYGNRIAIVSNGAKQEGQQWGVDHAPEIDPFSAEGITVIRGASSLLYGSEAIGGVVLLNPYQFDFVQHTNKTMVGTTFGYNGRLFQPSFQTVQYINSAWALRMNANGKYSGDVKTPSYYLNNTGTREWNGSAQMIYHTPIMDLENTYSSFNSVLGIFKGAEVGNITDLQTRIKQGNPLSTSSFEYGINRPYQEVHHQKWVSQAIIRKNGEWKINYTFQNNLRQEYDVIRNSGSNAPQMQLVLQTQHLDMQWKHPKFSAFSGTMGIQNQYQDNTWAGVYLIPDYQTFGTGLFAVEQYEWSKKTNIEAGLRYDYKWMQASMFEQPKKSLGARIYPTFLYNAISGNLGMGTWLSNYTKLVFNIGKAWRPPSMYELFANGVHAGTASIERGDKNLKVESGWNTNLDIRHQTNWLSFNATFFYHYITNYIYVVPSKELELTVRGAFPVYEYQQTDAHYFGADFYTKMYLHKDVWVDGYYNLVRAYEVHSRQHLALIPADRARANLVFEPIENHELSFGASYTYKQTRVSDDSDFAPIPPAYALLNAGYWGSFCIKKYELKLGLSIQNLLNTKYRDYLNRFRYYSDEMGRNISVRLFFIF